MIFDDVVVCCCCCYYYIQLFSSVFSAERNETSTNANAQDHYHHHHQQQHQLLPASLDTITTTTTATTTSTIKADTSSLSMTSALNVVDDNPLLVIADVVSTHSNSNKTLGVPKRRSYRNHNMRQSVASQVTRSVRKRRYFFLFDI